MEFFTHNTKIDFMGLRKYAAGFSILLFALSVLSLCIFGLNWGLDFTGGTQVELSFAQPVNLSQVRGQLDRAGLQKVVVQTYGSSRELLVSIGEHKSSLQENQKLLQDQLKNQILKALPEASFRSVNYIGSSVSSELAYKGFLAVIVALIATMIYIAMRFEYRLAVSAAVAMIHDPILILGIFSVMQIQFDLTALAGVLTVIGYSLNDTIVVFDRVRENFRKMRKASPLEVVNASINQTLSRTIMTSSLTLTVVIVLFLFGGPSIHAFSLALIIGVVVGTYSSIYVAGAFAVFLGLTRKDLMPSNKKELEAAP